MNLTLTTGTWTRDLSTHYIDEDTEAQKPHIQFVGEPGSAEIFFFLTFWPHHVACGILKFPDQRLNPKPLRWKHGVLTAGPPEKSQEPGFELTSVWLAVSLTGDLDPKQRG